MNEMASANEHNLKDDQKILFAIFGIVSGLPLFLTLVLVVPSYKDLSRESSTIISYFYGFGEEAIESMIYLRKKISEELMEIRSKKSKSSLSSSRTSLTAESENFSSLFFMARMSSVPSHTKMLIVYIVGVTLLLGGLVANLLIARDAGQYLFYAGPEGNYAGSRTLFSYRILSMVQELIRNDKIIWDNITLARQELEYSADMVYIRLVID